MPAERKHPLSYEDAARRAGVSSQIPLGVRPIRVRRIVGSAGKADKIGPDFLPLGPGPASAHYKTILLLMKEGHVFPPITVYQIGSRYFVIDGHTRVAAAKALGVDFLDAEVIECLPRKEGEVNLTYYARKELERSTGLEGIRLTAPWRYHLLHHHIEGYRLYLERSLGRDVSLPEAARIWHRSQYMPTLLEIRRRKLTSNTGGHTAGDVYTDILKAWAEGEGLAVSLREMLDRYDNQARQNQSTLTRARRRVTGVVDASLPKAIPPLGLTSREALAQSDVEAELETLSDDEPT
ncbi:MAG: hypothetical protein JOZ41_14720 [Chloroflexi bacterium]|nr:hypothetical protein [Chloroflexota bacterium]